MHSCVKLGVRRPIFLAIYFCLIIPFSKAFTTIYALEEVVASTMTVKVRVKPSNCRLQRNDRWLYDLSDRW